MRLWIDDIREAPAGWLVARTYADAIHALDTNQITEISFDHDLGEEKTGYDIACWVEGRVASGERAFIPKMGVHSANPVGRRNIEAAIASINRLSDKQLASGEIA